MDLKKKYYHIRNRNPNNKWITTDFINNKLKEYGVNNKINDIEIYKEAFIHENYKIPSNDIINLENPLKNDEIDENYKKYIPFQNKSYERLEFLGDRVLELIVCDYIFHRYKNENDGFLSSLKMRMIRGSTLSVFSSKLEFDKYIIISKRYENNRKDMDILEDVFEAFLGALYTDFGCGGIAYEVCKTFMFSLIEKYLNMAHIVRQEDNYKKQLMEYYHLKYKVTPKYIKVSTYGPTYNMLFKAAVLNIDGNIIATGEGSTLKDAEQLAAKEALKSFGVEIYDNENEYDKSIYT